MVPKKSAKTALAEIVAFIKTKFPRGAGILYCLSRKECENQEYELKKNNIKAMSYHAGLSDKQRNDVQSKWISNKIQVIH